MTAAPRRIREYEAVVSRLTQETPDTVTLSLFTGNERLDYLPGQFCTIDPHQFRPLASFIAFLEDKKGRREAVRAYSLASAPHEEELAFTVKEEPYVSGVTEYPPLLSPYLVHATPVGTRLTLSGFTGPYTLPVDVESRTDHLVHVVAGSGAVPNLSLLKHSLRAHPKLRHTFIASNKTWADVPFRPKLAELEQRFPERLRVIHTLTREPDDARLGPTVRRGRVNAPLLAELIPDPDTCLVYVCGPAITPWDRKRARETGTPASPRFMECVLGLLKERGVEERRIRRESYG